MRAARLHKFDETLKRDELLQLEELPNPQVQEPDDVIVRIGGAGLCRTDLHIIAGTWRAKLDPPLPYILGHENAGWVHDVGTAVRNVKPGDPVIVHPLVTDATCPACRRGQDIFCQSGWFPGISHDGGFAEFLRTKERSLIKLPANLDPREVAPHADAGLTAYRAARKAAEILKPGMTAAVVGFGGLGHIAAQVLRSLCAATIVVVDTSAPALKLAEDLGFAHRVMGGRDAVDDIRRLTDGGADAVIDFVGERGTPEQAMAMLRRGGTYFVAGYGGSMQVATIDLIFGELNIVGNLVGNYSELVELMTLAAQGKVKLTTRAYRLDQVNEAMHDLIEGRLIGRGVLVP